MDCEEKLLKQMNQLKSREDINSGQHIEKNLLIQNFFPHTKSSEFF